jgi:penicillin-binding protein 1A
MVDAYTTFPNKGLRVEPLYVTRIEDNNGNLIATFTPRMKEIINESTSYKMIHMLQGVINGGTGVRVRYKYNITAEACGRNQEPTNNSDGLFFGLLQALFPAHGLVVKIEVFISTLPPMVKEQLWLYLYGHCI